MRSSAPRTQRSGRDAGGYHLALWRNRGGFIGDLDGDGWPDLFTAGPYCAQSQLLVNQEGSVDVDGDGVTEILRLGSHFGASILLRAQ